MAFAALLSSARVSASRLNVESNTNLAVYWVGCFSSDENAILLTVTRAKVQTNSV